MSDDKNYKPRHLLEEKEENDAARQAAPQTAFPETASVLGIPIPDMGSEAEFVPIPGDTRVGHIAPNGVIIRNPWSERPEIKPDNEYTEEQQDLNLIQL